MKKIFTRVAVALLILTIAAIIVCFYINQFAYAYGLILVLFFVFAGLGQLYKLRNDEYMFEKEMKRQNEQIEKDYLR
ncbi:hypothetical protein [Paenibacillus sp. sgz500958]|uniref:hypothetical protein n=1 Tax=Paenibacillus sp. sgz500958 TaxID=3242475 RepID=UPI0036D2BD6F